ncbi:MAG TPA: hypothetical protein PK313_03290 [Myxococcota bacterium]|nr:hypothetical protein [Myxococcota bacterium]
MGPVKRMFLLVGVMSVVAAGVTIATIAILYRTALGEERLRLQEAAQSQARLIESIARFDETYSREYPGGARAATLAQIVDAHSRYRGFGDTGEFMVARREGDTIVYLMTHRHGDLDRPRPVPWVSNLGEPMRRALSGRSGTVIALDYHGTEVLAAHEPVAELDLGIVAKIDLAEVRAPFVRAGMLAGAVAIVLVLAGTLLFFRVTNPLIHQLNRTVADLERTLGEVKTLRGIIPICSFCRKVRNDQGYWDMVEVYVREHSEADFSHSVCPDCMQIHYGDLLAEQRKGP